MLKGFLFEQWVVKQFNSQGFTLLEWRSDKEVNGIYPLSSKKPDLVFELNSGELKMYYAIECKWRKDLSNEFNLVSKRKLQEYKDFSDKMQTPVFVAIGVGGSPGNPEQTYLIHLSELVETGIIGDRFLKSYLWPDLNKYFLNSNIN